MRKKIFNLTDLQSKHAIYFSKVLCTIMRIWLVEGEDIVTTVIDFVGVYHHTESRSGLARLGIVLRLLIRYSSLCT